MSLLFFFKLCRGIRKRTTVLVDGGEHELAIVEIPSMYHDTGGGAVGGGAVGGDEGGGGDESE